MHTTYVSRGLVAIVIREIVVAVKCPCPYHQSSLLYKKNWVPVPRLSWRIIDTHGVADPGCLSRIPDPDFYPPRIPEPKSATKERGEKICCHTFFCSHKFHKILKGLSYEIDFENVDENRQILALTRAAAGFCIFQRHL